MVSRADRLEVLQGVVVAGNAVIDLGRRIRAAVTILDDVAPSTLLREDLLSQL